ncbi:MAG: Kazal-type serine protease inhibitor family protein [Candidatus Micrarchaeia archaeon]
MRYTLFLLAVALAIFLFGCTQVCSDQSAPVCGSDGNTYKNPCYAQAAGVGIAYEGACTVALCTDSDNGKNVLEKGKASYKGVEYMDTCSGTSVVEYYCSENGLKSETIVCPEGQSCSDGKCVSLECSDSDGDDILTAGYVTYGGNKVEDVCRDSATVTEQLCANGKPAAKDVPCGTGYTCNKGRCVEMCTSTAKITQYDIYKKDTTTLGPVSKTDFCLDAERVVDFFCKEGRIENKTTFCPTGYTCRDGACSTPSCADSDNGKEIYTLGKVVKGRNEYTDQCYDLNKVREYYCEDNEVKSEIIDCPAKYTCLNGICVPLVQSTCIDNERDVDMYKRGKVIYNGVEYEDDCIDTDRVRDYYCTVGSELAHTVFMCPSGYYCNGGACIRQPGCYDSDGGVNKYVAGYVIAENNKTYYDRCYTGSSVLEYSCTLTSVVSQTLDCGYGHVCENGACN